MLAIVSGLQISAAVSWLLVAWHYAPSLCRVLTLNARKWDAAQMWVCLFGVTQIMFSMLWLIEGAPTKATMPTSYLVKWAVCYFASTCVAIGILYTWREKDADLAKGRARASLLMWCAVVGCSVVLAGSVG